MLRKTYTTTQVSRICDVYPASVINWIKRGDLRCYITPGGHRRVLRDDLISFLKKINIPMPAELTDGHKRILIVDDDQEMAQMIKRAFEKHNQHWIVETLNDPIEALVNVGQNPPDLLVIDVIMPKMNGLDICLKLSGLRNVKRMKIFAYSGKKQLELKDYKKYGIDAFYHKPFQLMALVNRAADFLGVTLGVAN